MSTSIKRISTAVTVTTLTPTLAQASPFETGANTLQSDLSVDPCGFLAESGRLLG